jgi:DNA-binding GntR family transcriptional regulator
MADVEPIAPSLTLAAQGADALRNLILRGVLRPGDRLNEVELSSALGISRAPLREAIRHVASEGLLTTVTHKGAYVPNYTTEDLQDLYQVRIALETHAVRLFVDQDDPDKLAELRKVLDQAGAEIEQSGTPVYPNNLDFHRVLIELVGNRHLTEMATSIDRKLQLARSRSGHLPERAQEALKEHREILAALARGSADRAADLMTGHLQRSLANVLRLSSDMDAEASHSIAR